MLQGANQLWTPYRSYSTCHNQPRNKWLVLIKTLLISGCMLIIGDMRVFCPPVRLTLLHTKLNLLWWQTDTRNATRCLCCGSVMLIVKPINLDSMWTRETGLTMAIQVTTSVPPFKYHLVLLEPLTPVVLSSQWKQHRTAASWGNSAATLLTAVPVLRWWAYVTGAMPRLQTAGHFACTCTWLYNFKESRLSTKTMTYTLGRELISLNLSWHPVGPKAPEGLCHRNNYFNSAALWNIKFSTS